jgi:hypothetical protein
MDRAKVLESVCELISADRLDDAETTLVADHPRAQVSTPRGGWSMKLLQQAPDRSSSRAAAVLAKGSQETKLKARVFMRSPWLG